MSKTTAGEPRRRRPITHNMPGDRLRTVGKRSEGREEKAKRGNVKKSKRQKVKKEPGIEGPSEGPRTEDWGLRGRGAKRRGG